LECFIDDIIYKETTLSEHKMAFIRMDFKREMKGPGVWILNTEFKFTKFKKGIDHLLEEEKKDAMYLEDKRQWWENLKYSINYCKKLQRVKMAKEKERSLKVELNNKVNVQKVFEMEEKLKRIEEEKCKGALLRSKAKYTIEGDKCNRFFLILKKAGEKLK